MKHLKELILCLILAVVLFLGQLSIAIQYQSTQAKPLMQCLVFACPFNSFYEVDSMKISGLVGIIAIGVFLVNVFQAYLVVRTFIGHVLQIEYQKYVNQVRHNYFFNLISILFGTVFIQAISSYLPNGDFRSQTLDKIYLNLRTAPNPHNSYESPIEFSNSQFKTQLQTQGQYYYQVFPDITIQQTQIISLLLLSFLNKFSSIKRLLNKHSTILGSSVTLFQGIQVFFTVVMITFEAIQWQHDHAQMGNHWSTPLDRVHRGSGCLAVIIMSAMLICSTKNNIVNSALDLSYEHSLLIHRALAYLFLGFSLLHMFCSWRVFQDWNVFPHDIQAIPNQFPTNDPTNTQELGPAANWTVAYMTYTFQISLIMMFGFSLQCVRRCNYQLFQVAHMYQIVLFSAVLVHANHAWPTLLFSFFVMVVNKIFNMNVASCDLVNAKHVASKKQIALELKLNNLSQSHSQQVQLNIPAISITEWHPFSIASIEQPRVSFLIKNNGVSNQRGVTFTQKLSALVDTQELFDVNIDGPYGTSQDYSLHNNVLLLAGGVGITPLKSTILHQNNFAKNSDFQTRFTLVWVVREAEMLQEIDDLQNESSINIKVYYTGNSSANEISHGGWTKSFIKGRPDLDKLVADNLQDMISVCGPTALVDLAREVSRTRGIDYKEEIFEF